MRLDSDHSPLYTFYNMNGLGWEPRQKVDCISSGYFYPVFVIISTRDIPISVSGDESGNILLSLSLTILGLLLGSQYLPSVMSWCWQDAAVHCSQVSVGDTAQARDRVSWQCHESARMSCCHESDRHLWWCLLVSQHCILLWHLPTLAPTWWDKILPPFLPKYLYQSVCPTDSCYC